MEQPKSANQILSELIEKLENTIQDNSKTREDINNLKTAINSMLDNDITSNFKDEINSSLNTEIKKFSKRIQELLNNISNTSNIDFSQINKEVDAINQKIETQQENLNNNLKLSEKINEKFNLKKVFLIIVILLLFVASIEGVSLFFLFKEYRASITDKRALQDKTEKTIIEQGNIIIPIEDYFKYKTCFDEVDNLSNIIKDKSLKFKDFYPTLLQRIKQKKEQELKTYQNLKKLK